MARRLWGCYSVNDHLEKRAFVADLLLYDRLVVPVPTKDDLGRWEGNGWNPERQERLLDIVGPFAERIEWSPGLRDQFQAEWSPGNAAQDLDAPFGLTRRIVSEQLDKLNTQAHEADVRAVAVYAKPDRFDREWKVTHVAPFVHRMTRMTPGRVRETADVVPEQQHDRAKLVVTRLVVPNDGRSDDEVLKRLVDLISRGDVADRRAAFQERIASFASKNVRDETVIGEFEDDLDAYNAAIKSHTSAQKTRLALQVLTTAEAAAALWAPPAGLLAGPTSALAEAGIQRRWPGDPSQSRFNSTSLLAEAKRALAK